MQLERSEVAFFIYTNGSQLRFNLTQRYATTDETLKNMTTWPLVTVPKDESKVHTYHVVNKEAFQARLDDFRQVSLLVGILFIALMFKQSLFHNIYLRNINSMAFESIEINLLI